MMRGIRRVVVFSAVTGLLVAGAVTVSMEAAHANFASLCDATSSTSNPPWSCSLTGTLNDPSAVSIGVTDDNAAAGSNTIETVLVNWQVSCVDSTNGTEATAGAPESPTPATVNLTLPITADGQCQVSATVSLPSGELSGSSFTPEGFTAVLNYTPANPVPTASATTSSASGTVHPIKGYDGKCVDDNGNSSANRSHIQIWGCSGSDQAENWSFSGNELKHNGKCMNDQGNAGSGGKVILYSCNGGSNEKWSELANGELKLQSHNGTLCLDDPRSSTKNGTQLIVYTCHDSANQKWSLP